VVVTAFADQFRFATEDLEVSEYRETLAETEVVDETYLSCEVRVVFRAVAVVTETYVGDEAPNAFCVVTTDEVVEVEHYIFVDVDK
jgi:hypothetical protein